MNSNFPVKKKLLDYTFNRVVYKIVHESFEEIYRTLNYKFALTVKAQNSTLFRSFKIALYLNSNFPVKKN